MSLLWGQLQSKAQHELLDAIDKLRSCDLSKEPENIELPQLIVCGDQSAGKRSVLEAISQVYFPQGAGCQTRFACELVLRRELVEHITVSIIPATSATDKEKKYLREFQAELHDPKGFAKVIRDAQQHLARNLTAGRTFCEHRLRAEICGPDQVHLTLVDLPGLIQTGNTDDCDTVKSITETYMKNSKAIILAVMAAGNHAETQPVFELARRHDPHRHRTLGVRTKPDLIDPGSAPIKLRLASNGELQLGLGWHVLKNRGEDDRAATSEDRDKMEAAFFENSDWRNLPDTLRGIPSLRAKLSSVLFKTITSSLPGLVRSIKASIESCKQHMEVLDDPRPDTCSKQRFLNIICGCLAQLIRDGLKGDESDVFFEDAPGQDGIHERLRAALCQREEAFAKAMLKSSNRYHVLNGTTTACTEHACKLPTAPTILKAGDDVVCLPWAVYLNALEEFIDERKGEELRGAHKTSVVTNVFHLHASPWKQIAEDYVLDCFNLVSTFFKMALYDAAPAYTASAIIDHIVEEAFERLEEMMRQKFHELLKTFRYGHRLMTLNPIYVAEEARVHGGLSHSNIKDMRCINVLSQAGAYYTARAHAPPQTER